MRFARLLAPALAGALALVCTEANAVFFFFIPGSVITKVGDAITGAEGDSCVGASAKVGDVIKSPNGNTATVKSLSGTSSRCQDPRLPIRALLTFNYTFVSKAGMDVPDGYESKPLTDMQHFQGNVLHLVNSAKRMGVFVAAQPRTESSDAATLARNVDANISRAIDNAKTSHDEELTINGVKALRFEVEGKNKGIFGATFTYVVTVLEGRSELVVITASAPTKADFQQEREEMQKLAYRVQGLTDIAAVAIEPTQPSASAPQLATGKQSSPDIGVSPLQPPTGGDSQAASTPATGQNGDSPDLTASRLRQLDKLFKEGVLTKDEYESKKRELLKSL